VEGYPAEAWSIERARNHSAPAEQRLLTRLTCVIGITCQP
jgi:hypothetical protein